VVEGDEAERSSTIVLVDGTYELIAEHRGSAPLQLGVTLDLDALG
jgi:hypothetical protein